LDPTVFGAETAAMASCQPRHPDVQKIDGGPQTP
jgi:hypothetical protein